MRKRYVSDRSSHDGGQYGPRQEPELYGRRMATYCRKEIWYDTCDEAEEMVDLSVETDIQGYDIDEDMVK